MENLLPEVASADVTSNQFREKSLPYQQWEAKRTYLEPSTPSDIGYLLPPIHGRKSRGVTSAPLPIPPRIEPTLPRPAPVDRNLSNLYDPALDPSPIGVEERGISQPVRITRVTPREELISQESRASTRHGGDFGNTAVTIINGYRDRTSNREKGGQNGEFDVDIFIQGLRSGIEHSTLHPSEVVRRSLQSGPPHFPIPETPALQEGLFAADAKKVSLGLTVMLTRMDEWFECHGVQGSLGGDYQPAIGLVRDDLAPDPTSSKRPECLSERATRILFQREDGTLAPSINAFRVQFEPGPLGMELEEDPGLRGIVQVRRVLQAGQAEQDGRISAGALIVAVGDREDPTNTGTVDNVDENGLDFDTLESHAQNKTRPSVIRSLEELEEAVLRREPDRLFVIWALDRLAPEAIAVLGAPEPSSGRPLPRPLSSRSLFTGDNKNIGGEEGAPYLADGGKCTDKLHTLTTDGEGSPIVSPNSRGRFVGDIVGAPALEGAPGWESSRPYGGIYRKEYSFFKGDPCITSDSSQVEKENLHAIQSEDKLIPAQGSLLDERHWRSSAPSLDCRSDRESMIGKDHSFQGSGTWVGREGWEFETGGGMFDENDQGLASRKQPLHDNQDIKLAEEKAREEQKFLPLGLRASAAGDFPVYIWFCNCHESDIMKISWINYDGKRVPRKSLAPGGCYFERSFATHPWVIHHDSVKSNDGCPGEYNPERDQASAPTGEEENNCCVVRLGDTMAIARLTGSLIWNPGRKTLSVTKQVKVEVPGMSASALAAVGIAAREGVGLDPGKKGMCFTGTEREAEATRAMAERASVRKQKTKILEEMRTWRMHTTGGADVGDVGVVEGLGQGAPNLRVVMLGSS